LTNRPSRGRGGRSNLNPIYNDAYYGGILEGMGFQICLGINGGKVLYGRLDQSFNVEGNDF
jgi:hypothetical protein